MPLLLNTPIFKNKYITREVDTVLIGALKNNFAKVVEISGKPGTGKSILINYNIFHQENNLLQEYEAIIWISCNDPKGIDTQIEVIANKLNDNGAVENPIEFLREYLIKNTKWLVVLDDLNKKTLGIILEKLNINPPLKGQLIYTCTNSLINKFEDRGFDVNQITTNELTEEEVKILVKKCLPDDQIMCSELSKLVKITHGIPGFINHLCNQYKGNIKHASFSLFFQEKSETINIELARLFKPRIEKCLVDLDSEDNNSTIIIQQAAYMGPAEIPFDFFIGMKNQNNFNIINKLASYQLGIIAFNREMQSFSISELHQQVLKEVYSENKKEIIAVLIERFSKFFSYLTTYESNKDKISSQELSRYKSHVHYLLFEQLSLGEPDQVELFVNDKIKELIADNEVKVIELLASLGRLYYLQDGDLQLALKCLEKGKEFVKKRLKSNLIDEYKKKPKLFKINNESTEKDILLLRLYAREFLFQTAIIKSQLANQYQDISAEIIQDLKDAYFIQRNLPDIEPISVAYTLRNLTRAMRKQRASQEKIDKYFEKLEDWIKDYKPKIDILVQEQLLSDKGIIKKEKKDYLASIDALKASINKNLEIKLFQRGNRDLAQLFIYLGESYLGANQFEKSIVSYYLTLVNAGGSKKWFLRAYFNLTNAFYENKYYALADMYIEKTLPLQKIVYCKNEDQTHRYVEKTTNLQKVIREKLIEKVSTDTVIKPSFATLNKFLKITDRKEHFHKTFLNGVEDKFKPSLALNAGNIVDNIIDVISISKANLAEAESILCHDIKQKNKLDNLQSSEKALSETSEMLLPLENFTSKVNELQQQKDILWYREFDYTIELMGPLKLFKDQFAVKLLNKVVKKIRIAAGKDIKYDKTDIAEGLIKGFSNILPKIDFGATVGVKGTVDLPAVVQGVATAIADRHRNERKTEATIISEFYSNEPDKLFQEIKTQVEEMAEYVARCYQPLIDKLDKGNAVKDIERLAKVGANRVINYQKKGTLELTTSLRELVMIALMKGTGAGKLDQIKETSKDSMIKHHWYVQGFFSKPLVKVFERNRNDISDVKESFYIPDKKRARPRDYYHRWGSPVEVRIMHYDPPYESESLATAALDESQQNKYKI